MSRFFMSTIFFYFIRKEAASYKTQKRNEADGMVNAVKETNYFIRKRGKENGASVLW